MVRAREGKGRPTQTAMGIDKADRTVQERFERGRETQRKRGDGEGGSERNRRVSKGFLFCGNSLEKGSYHGLDRRPISLLSV